MIQDVKQYAVALEAQLDEVQKYLDKDCTNASAARRIRKASLELAKQGKTLRKLTVEHHK